MAFLNFNPNAIQYLEQNPSKIAPYILSDNSNPNFINLLEHHMDKFDHKNEILWHDIFINPHAIYLIEKNIDKLFNNDAHWFPLSKNPHPRALRILKEHPDKISFKALSMNTNLEAIQLLEENYDKIHFPVLCMNPSAICLIERRLSEPYIPEIDFLDFRSETPFKNIHWGYLSSNENAIHILEKNIDLIDWHYLSSNPNAVRLLEQHPDKIKWSQLCFNENAIHLIEKNLDKVDWRFLSENPNAIHILEANKDKINYKHLSKNSAIFVYDYDAMRESYKDLKEELMKVMWSPERILDLLEKGIDIEDM
jgi:hypothetical protein